MKCITKLVLSSVLFFFYVFQPIKANLIASVATSRGLDLNGQVTLLGQAAIVDECNSDILNTLGDAYLKGKSYTMAAVIYGQAMACSPGRAEFRFKYGEMLLAQGFLEGRQNVDDALLLEPNNPYYKAEAARLTKFQQQ